jgi:hypothetical protein
VTPGGSSRDLRQLPAAPEALSGPATLPAGGLTGVACPAPPALITEFAAVSLKTTFTAMGETLKTVDPNSMVCEASPV